MSPTPRPPLLCITRQFHNETERISEINVIRILNEFSDCWIKYTSTNSKQQKTSVMYKKKMDDKICSFISISHICICTYKFSTTAKLQRELNLQNPFLRSDHSIFSFPTKPNFYLSKTKSYRSFLNLIQNIPNEKAHLDHHHKNGN